MLRGVYLLLLAVDVAAAAERFTTLKLNVEAFGSIVGTNEVIVGSGFVVGGPERVMTCEHVVASQSAYRFNFINAAGAHIPLTVETLLPRYDLAVLRLNLTNALSPFPFGDIRRIRPGDDVVYMGWNAMDNSLKVSKSVVTATGVVLNDGVSVDFLEFQGEGIPGYSGGPILNHRGEVVALMREAWTKRGVKGGPEALVNRGFAIEPAMLAKEIHYPITPVTNGIPAGTNTISIRLDLK